MSIVLIRRISLVVAIFLGIAIFYVSTRPLKDLRDANYPQINEWFDAMNHFIAFFVWTLFWRIGNPEGGWKRIFPAVLFGALCEIAQLFVPTRGFQMLDLFVNMAPSFIIERFWWFKEIHLETGPVLRKLNKR